MSKYRKKPISVKAEQFFPSDEKWPEGVEERLRVEVFSCRPGDPDDVIAVIKTLEGWYIVSPGDWIITGIKGEKYPCKPNIFAATYEKVEEDPTASFRNEDGTPEMVLNE